MREGLRFALAGTLSLGAAQILGLSDPTWAVTTAFVLSMPKFAGAIGEKTILRLAGAVLGAMIGTLLTATLARWPWIFLPAMGLLVSFTTAMYGARFAPYGFRQLGYTATLVAAGAMADPALAARIGLARCEEICVGIVVTVAVSSWVWPRYARLEFVRQARGLLAELAAIFRAQQAEDPGAASRSGVLEEIGGRFARMRVMIRLGAMESRLFRQRLPLVDDAVAELGMLGAAISNFGRTLPAESIYRQFIWPAVEPLYDALNAAMDCLADPGAAPERREAARAAAWNAFDAYQKRLAAFRQTHAGDHASVDESLAHAGHALALDDIRRALSRLAEVFPHLEEPASRTLPSVRLEAFRWPGCDAVRAGLRGGLSVLLGLLLLRLFDLPGGGMLLVGLYLFTVFSMDPSNRRGDIGVFRPLATLALAGAAALAALVPLAPWLSHPMVLGATVAGLLFLAGHALERGRIAAFGGVAALLFIATVVSVPTHHLVTPMQVAGPVAALLLAAAGSAVIRRLLWPVLPQDALRSRLVELLALLEQAAADPARPTPPATRAALSLTSAECAALTGVLEDLRLLDSDASARIRAHVAALARLGGHLLAITGPPGLPPAAANLFCEERARLLDAVGRQLHAQRKAILGNRKVPAATRLPEPRAWTERCRMHIRDHSAGTPGVYLALGLLYRIEQIAATAAQAAAASEETTLPA